MFYNALLFLVFIVLLTFAYAGVRAAPWLPMWKKDVERFLKLAEIKPGHRFYDLGCGDGRLVFAAAKAGAISTGFEISLLPYILAQIRQLIWPEKNARIKFKDFWRANLSDADVVYIYLMPRINNKIKSKFEKELKKGTKVICYVWPIEGWQPQKIDREPGRSSLYLYQM